MTTHQLRLRQITVLTAGDAATAVLACHRHPAGFDVLITDLNMPSMSGGELARAATSIRPAIKVIYISGMPRRIAVSNRLIPADGLFVAKPCTIDQLHTVLTDIVPQSVAAQR